MHHMALLWYTWSIHSGWGSNPESYLLIQLPIIRLVISGFPWVACFFVVSGYALSYKTLKLIHADNYPDAYAALSSSIFRRQPRLFIPPIVLISPSILFAYFGWHKWEPIGVLHPSMPQLDSIWAQMSDYALFAVAISNPLNPVYIGRWGGALWTLPYEFRGSLFVYGVLLALARLPFLTRFLILTGIMGYTLRYVHWDTFLFASGVVLADLNLYSSLRSLRAVTGNESWLASLLSMPSSWRFFSMLPTLKERTPAAWKKSKRLINTLFWPILLILDLFVLSMPRWDSNAQSAFGFQTLAKMVPNDWVTSGNGDKFWASIAAVALLYIVDHSPILQRVLFNNRLGQYLGRISYALYIVHLPILYSLGYHLAKLLLGMRSAETDTQWFIAIIATSIPVWIVVLFAAHLGMEYVDTKVVRLTNWLYRWLSRE